MFFVYVLQSDKTNGFYIGSTRHPERRSAEHNANLARATAVLAARRTFGAYPAAT